MGSFSIQLSLQGLSHIPDSQFRDTFEFVVGKRRFRCDPLMADFLSPKLSRLHEVDSALNEYVVQTADHRHHFSKFLSVARGESLSVDPSNAEFLSSLCRELENDELCQLLSDDDSKSLTIDNIVARLYSRRAFSGSANREMEFLARHFYKVPHQILATLPYEIFAEVLGHSRLRLRSEDWLYRLISSHFDTEPHYIDLLEFVSFEFLSRETMMQFANESRNFFSAINSSVWARVCERLLFEGSSADNPRVRIPGTRCEFRDGGALNGVIHFLTRKHGGDVIERQVVKVIASSERRFGAPARSIVDFASLASRYLSDHTTAGWIGYDFLQSVILVTHYTLKSHLVPCLRTWVFEGSLDEGQWFELDKRVDVGDIDGMYKAATFEIAHPQKCRAVRVRQTGPAHNDATYPGDFFALCAMEVFGTLYPKKRHRH
jgi:hypothetical protein